MLYVKRIILEKNILYVDLFVLSERGFKLIMSQNDHTNSHVDKFIEEHDLKWQGTDGAGNTAESFYI